MHSETRSRAGPANGYKSAGSSISKIASQVSCHYQLKLSKHHNGEEAKEVSILSGDDMLFSVGGTKHRLLFSKAHVVRQLGV